MARETSARAYEQTNEQIKQMNKTNKMKGGVKRETTMADK
jgi:hypothetical protein